MTTVIDTLTTLDEQIVKARRIIVRDVCISVFFVFSILMTIIGFWQQVSVAGDSENKTIFLVLEAIFFVNLIILGGSIASNLLLHRELLTKKLIASK